MFCVKIYLFGPIFIQQQSITLIMASILNNCPSDYREAHAFLLATNCNTSHRRRPERKHSKYGVFCITSVTSTYDNLFDRCNECESWRKPLTGQISNTASKNVILTVMQWIRKHVPWLKESWNNGEKPTNSAQRRNESNVCVFYSNMNIIKVLKFQGIEIVL